MNQRNLVNSRYRAAFRAAVCASFAAAAVSIAWPGPAGAADAKAAAAPDLSETDMSHTGKAAGDTVTVPWNLLGGALGNQTVGGVRVELYVLQAQDAGKLKPGDPNHAFTVTLKDDASGEFLKQGEVSIAVADNAGASKQRTVMSQRSSGIFRGGVALAQPGEYRLTVAFKTGGREGQVDFPYQFREDAVPAHHHH